MVAVLVTGDGSGGRVISDGSVQWLWWFWLHWWWCLRAVVVALVIRWWWWHITRLNELSWVSNMLSSHAQRGVQRTGCGRASLRHSKDRQSETCALLGFRPPHTSWDRHLRRRSDGLVSSVPLGQAWLERCSASWARKVCELFQLNIK